jgi:hypothetical protein
MRRPDDLEIIARRSGAVGGIIRPQSTAAPTAPKPPAINEMKRFSAFRADANARQFG